MSTNDLTREEFNSRIAEIQFGLDFVRVQLIIIARTRVRELRAEIKRIDAILKQLKFTDHADKG